MRKAFPRLSLVRCFFIALTLLGPACPAGAAPDQVTLNMRDADIRAFIQWIAEQTHRQIVIDPRVQGRVSIFSDQPVSVDQAYQIFLAALQTQGFTTAETDGVLKIFPQPLARGGPRQDVTGRTETAQDGQIMRVVDLHNVVAKSLATLIKPLLTATGYIAPLPGSNSLIIADDGSVVEQLTALMHHLDTGGSLDVDIIRLRHANARDIAQVLAPLATGGKPGTGGAAPIPLSIAADTHSNSILLAGDPASRQRAAQLVRQLDQPIATTDFSRVVFLHYLSAKDLVPVLKGTAETRRKGAKEQAVNNADVSIEASESANALVLTGPSDQLDALQQTIAHLDVPRPQVLVQAIIVEVSQDLANSLGVQWNTDFASNGTQAATSFGLAPTAAALAAAGSDPAAALGSGLTLGYYKGGTLRALINALATSTDADLLSTPSVMTLDNEQAQIVVGSNIPLITGQMTSGAAGTATPFTTYERKDVGIKLKLTPQVSDDGMITLAVEQDVESVVNTQGDASLAGARDIVTNKRSINTKVMVGNNDVLVLGGLISDENQRQVSKVPVLGDLPLVGRLFRSTTDKTVKRNLMVFIHPTIVASPEVASNLSRTRYDAMRRLQQQPPSTTTTGTDHARPVLPEFETIRPRAPQQPVTSPSAH